MVKPINHREQSAMHCHTVLALLSIFLVQEVSSHLTGACPAGEEIYWRCFMCQMDPQKLKKLHVLKFKPGPPVVERLYDGNILSISRNFLLDSSFSFFFSIMDASPSMEK